ncbi:MAG: cytochrome P450 [Paraglaciecola psychrophila]|jgi:cytochrome P450
MSEPDAYQLYRNLRHTAPVSREPDGPWQVALYDDVKKVLREQSVFSSDVVLAKPDEKRTPSMLFSDPPIHSRLRKLVSRTFAPNKIALQREPIALRCEELMVAMAQHKKVDLIDALAAPLPVTVIAGMLGVEDGDMLAFKYWSDTIFSNIADILFAEMTPEVEKARDEMNAYFIGRIAQLRLEPKDHLLSQLIETETEEGKLSDDELLSFCALLLIAGNETTTGLITASVRVFHEMPEIFAALNKDPDLIPSFVEETLRFYSPFSATVRRCSTAVELSGVTIAAGELVLPLIASANRDEAVFTDADNFVVDRSPNPHLGFGSGIHNCLGAALARLEGEIAVRGLIEHFQAITIVNYDPVDLSQFGGPKSLLVELTPK